MKIADETLDALFDMELPLPRPVVRSLAEGIDTILQKCANNSTPVCIQIHLDGLWNRSPLTTLVSLCSSSRSQPAS